MLLLFSNDLLTSTDIDGLLLFDTQFCLYSFVLFLKRLNVLLLRFYLTIDRLKLGLARWSLFEVTLGRIFLLILLHLGYFSVQLLQIELLMDDILLDSGVLALQLVLRGN